MGHHQWSTRLEAAHLFERSYPIVPTQNVQRQQAGGRVEQARWRVVEMTFNQLRAADKRPERLRGEPQHLSQTVNASEVPAGCASVTAFSSSPPPVPRTSTIASARACLASRIAIMRWEASSAGMYCRGASA